MKIDQNSRSGSDGDPGSSSQERDASFDDAVEERKIPQSVVGTDNDVDDLGDTAADLDNGTSEKKKPPLAGLIKSLRRSSIQQQSHPSRKQGSRSRRTSGKADTSDLDVSSLASLSLEQRQVISEKFEECVGVDDHWYRVRKYPNTFVGKEAVDKMLECKLAETRQEAVHIGRMLAHDFNLFEHVHRDHEFNDKNLFYRFVDKSDRFIMAEDEIAALTMLGDAVVGDMDDNDVAPATHLGSLSEMAEAFEKGVEVRDNRYRLKTYNDTFVGSEAVDFLVASGMAPTRKSAVQLGREMATELNLFQHVTKSHEFKDDFLFYSFIPEASRRLFGGSSDSGTSSSLSLKEIAALFEDGVEVRDNRYRMKVHPNTFVASEAVDFLVKYRLAESRSDAVRIGLDLAEQLNLFEHVTGYRQFSDDFLFFRFVHVDNRRLPGQSFVGSGDSPTDLSRVADAFKKGVTVKRRRKYRLKTYKNTFVGCEAVDFLVNACLAESRKDAVHLGRTLAKQFNLFEHVTGSHEFTDDYLFFRFVNEGNRSSEFTDSTYESSTMPPEKIAEALRDGVEVNDKRWRLKTYHNVFVGSDAVDFLVDSGFVATRKEGVELGRNLAREFDLFEHVTRDHELEDDSLFYRFVNLGEIQPISTSALTLGTSELMDIARALEDGVEVTDHTYRLRTYSKTFLGSEAVDFLVKSGSAKSRQEAVYIGRALMERFNLFEHVTADHTFNDQSLFFRFVPESLRRSWEEENESELVVSIPQFGVVTADDEWRRRVLSFERKMMSKQSFSPSCSFSPNSDDFDSLDRLKRWAREFRRQDPRYQILNFFNDVAQEGADKIEETGINPDLLRPLLRYFSRASVFTVWRPTSYDAIRKMILGEAVGKGLDIKGKSAKRGKLSGFVPFLQISENSHKRQIRTLPKDGMVRLFFPGDARHGRDVAAEQLEIVAEEMIETVRMAKNTLADDKVDDVAERDAIQSMLLDMTNPSIRNIEDYAPHCYGLEVPVRLFWEAYIVRQDISRKSGSEYHTGRPSQPAFQDMNLASLRRAPKDGARAVLYHYDGQESPMSPLNLLMAYEEDDRVMPVVSDFDCFLVGTRGVSFSAPLAEDQLGVLKWCVSRIESILDSPQCDTWTSRWLAVLKRASCNGFHPHIPKYGFGDPKTYSLMEQAISRLRHQGAVRHGSECFNYYFPQELDEEFLVISENLPGQTLPWKYVRVEGLQKILTEKLDEGFTFPLNPKWILCDPGWKAIYDKLLASGKANVQDSVNIWYPPGIRKQIEAVASRHPYGFQRFPRDDQMMREKSVRMSGTTSMDLALLKLKHGSFRSPSGAGVSIQEELE